MAAFSTEQERLVDQFDLYFDAVNDGKIYQLMEFFYNETTCLMPPDHSRVGWCSQSNTTVREYAEDFYKSYNVGPKRGKYSCEKEVVPSGPDYLIINECKEYSKNKDGNMELSFISPGFDVWKKEANKWKLWIVIWNNLPEPTPK